MCKWRPADVPADADWSVKHQIVLPKRFWKEVLSLAHEIFYLAIFALLKHIINFFIISSDHV